MSGPIMSSIVRRIIVAVLIAVAAVWWGSSWAKYSVLLVDVIPASFEAEERGNSEASIAVNPQNPDQIVMLAHQLGRGAPCESDEAGLVESEDRGKTWVLSCGIPLRKDNTYAGDPSLAFTGDGSALLLAYMSPFGANAAVHLVRVIGLFDGDGTVSTTPLLSELKQSDQPAVATADAGGIERSWMGIYNYRAVCESGGHVYMGTGTTYVPVCVSVRPGEITAYSTRAAGHRDGDAYAGFYRYLSTGLLDLVVSRDDGTSPASEFRQLTDAAAEPGACSAPDMQSGARVARCLDVPYDDDPVPAMGLQRRVWSHVAIAVDPDNAKLVCVAWGDRTGSDLLTLHVRCSPDQGSSWSTAFVVNNATNPGLAIDADGRLGVLYQRLVPATGGGTSWDTTLEVLSVADDGGLTPSVKLPLATTPHGPDLVDLEPFLGDYTELQAVGTTFYGAFAAPFSPDCSWYRPGFVFTRAVPKPRCPVVAGATGPAASVDPFFVRATRRWWVFGVPTWLQWAVIKF
jgi:hypothetical protein